jgi:hypothetical protein
MHPDTPPDESNVLEKVETALKQAVRQDPDLNWEYGTRIKRQKFAYMAVEHFTGEDEAFPVTYSWYKFGAVMPAAPMSGTIGPVSTQMPTPQARESGIFTATFDEIVEFFREGATNPALNEETWYASDLDFLYTFYEHHAPEEYRELYLGNVELRQGLESAIRELEESEADPRSMSAGIDIDEYEAIGRAAARLHLGVVEDQSLGSTLDELRRFTNLVEDAFLVLAQTERREITDKQIGAIGDLLEVYDEWVWEYPALLMSKETAHGPNASTLRKWSSQKHFSLEDNLNDQIDAVARTCSEAGLTPSSAQYPDHDDEVETAGRTVALQAMRRDD